MKSKREMRGGENIKRHMRETLGIEEREKEIKIKKFHFLVR